MAAVLIAHDVEPWVERALRSVFAQSRRPEPVVVVENGSSDRTLEVLQRTSRSLGTEGSVTLVSKERLGVGGARNLGAEIGAAQGATAIAFLDGDDWWRPAFVEQVADVLFASERRAAAFGWPILRDEGGRLQGLRTALHRDYDYRAFCRYKSPMRCGSCLMVRTSDWSRIGGFDADLPSSEDWEFLLRLTRDGRVVGCAHRWLVNYRRRQGSLSRDGRLNVIATRSIETRHPRARRAKHWWWLLNLALSSGDAELWQTAAEQRPPVRAPDLLSFQFVRYLLLRSRRPARPPENR
ncbi:MAG: glycosyltransferase family 2 protein [Thermoanaerobaculia bacterium]